ncbi:MAG TPA: hypothetical protein VE443_02165, partial [Beijerinckiaceae bacterium]|nr:hypothetical protein [Beijerinckiaceae bacterium]
MRKLLLLAASAAALLTFTPEPADAQGMRRGGGYRGAGVVRRGAVVRPGVRYGVRPGYAYRRGGRGWGPAAVGLVPAISILRRCARVGSPGRAGQARRWQVPIARNS